MCKDTLTLLVRRYFGDQAASLKGVGRAKWNHISDAYNEIGEGVFERASGETLNAKWRNILYRGRILKEPHPLSNPKNIPDEKLLKDRINKLKLNAQFASFKNKSNLSKVKNTNVITLLKDGIGNSSPIDKCNRLKLSDIKREFGIGINFHILRTFRKFQNLVLIPPPFLIPDVWCHVVHT